MDLRWEEMAEPEQGLIITRDEWAIPSDKPTTISYKITIGITGHEKWGFCVGEARARVLNEKYYLLEMTRDSRYRRMEERDDNRRFVTIGEGVTTSKKEADKTLSWYVATYAKDVGRWCGLKVIDLTKKVEECGEKKK